MSYTMTVDMPERAKAYIMRQGPRFSEELNAIVLAVVQAKMQYEDLPTSDADEEAAPLEVNRAVPGKPKYDFSGFFGKCKLDGDPVAFQRKLRDEW